MRALASVVLILLLAACAGTPELPPAGVVSRVTYVDSVAIEGADQLLAAVDKRLYFAMKSGAVLVTDVTGQKMAVLQPKADDGTVVLKRPAAVALADATIYVADTGLHRVAMFSRNGVYQGSFDGIGMSDPAGIAVDGGVVYVTDKSKSQVQMLGVNGVFLGVLDIDNNPHNLAAAEATRGLPFRLGKPAGIVIDAIGRIYVLDAGDNRIKAYSRNGVYLGAIDKAKKPVALAVAADGLYVADENSYTIQKYDFERALAYTFGSKGDGSGQFASISGLALGAGGEVIVGDGKRGQVHAFKAESGSPLDRSGRGASEPSVRWISETALGASRIVWGKDEKLYAVVPGEKAIVVLQQGAIASKIKMEKFEPVAITIDSDGALWTVDRKQLRVVKFAPNGEIAKQFGKGGKGAGSFDEPTDISIASSGLIYVADEDRSWVQVFSADGVFLTALRDTSSGERLDEPIALSHDAEDNLYVLDGDRNTISVFSAKGEPVTEFGPGKDQPWRLRKPVDLAAAGNELFVLDESTVKVFSRDGHYLRTFGNRGKAREEFDELSAIASGNKSVVSIAQGGRDARIKNLQILHHPGVPDDAAASGGMHGVELSWQRSTLPYVAQYRVYRAEQASGPYTEIGATTVGRYSDQNLAPDRRFYYRVAAVSDSGFEGVVSAPMSAQTSAYIPPPLANVQVEPSAWSVEISWDALDRNLGASYRVYRKRDNNYVKLTESEKARVKLDSLQPRTDYVFYVSAVSSDGIESEKVEVNATTVVADRAPLEIEVIELKPVFSNTYKIYEEKGIGRIRVSNTTGTAMKGVKVGFVLKHFMDFPSESQIDALAPGQSKELVLKAVFNNKILDVTEDTPVKTELKATYFEDGKEHVYTKTHTVNVYEKHRLIWDERGRYASFITPKDPLLLDFIRSIAIQFGDAREQVQLAAALFNGLGTMGLTYIQDPTNPYQITSGKTDVVDYVQYPRETLERKSGDCDDLVALYSAALESLGIKARVIEVPGHMLMMFSTGIPADRDGYTMDNLYVIHDGELWIPVETTVIGSSFIKAWEQGSTNYYRWRGKDLALLDIHESWRTFKPASLPQSDWRVPPVQRDLIERAFPGEYNTILKIGVQTKTRRHLQAIAGNPKDVDAYNQVAIILARAGDSEEAMNYFNKTLAIDSRNAPALNNRGNLHFMASNFDKAAIAYRDALAVDGDDPLVWINLAKAYRALGQSKEAKEAFGKAQMLDPTMKKRYRALALELLYTL